MKKKLVRIVIRVSKAQQTKNRLQSRELMTPTLKSLPYFSLALFFNIKRPVGRLLSLLLRLLCVFMLSPSDHGSFTVTCEA